MKQPDPIYRCRTCLHIVVFDPYAVDLHPFNVNPIMFNLDEDPDDDACFNKSMTMSNLYKATC